MPGGSCSARAAPSRRSGSWSRQPRPTWPSRWPATSRPLCARHVRCARGHVRPGRDAGRRVVIVGVGIDVAEIDRFSRALRRTPALAERLFTERERGLPIRSLAARFAAKEALAKALGAPRGLLWTDAEVVTGPNGRPSLEV